MKDNVKIFLVALVIGMLVSYFFCYKFDNTTFAQALNSKVTYFYVGSYNSLEEANQKLENFNNALIYNDNGIYKVIIGVYRNEECIMLMDSYFLDKGIDFRINEMKIDNEFINAIENYELLIISSDKKYFDSLNNSILKVFNEYKS